ncbi:MAG: hypothetical protein SVV03_00975 [Candidatus Nanohaloarchaea archaeon]|nr:hypothetical protein [Candidatus Nanohaloarchaea archaeon]
MPEKDRGGLCSDTLKVLLVAFVALSFTLAASAQDDGSPVTLEEAKKSLERAKTHINDMKDENLPTLRVRDIYIDANATLVALREGGKEDFSRVVEKVERIPEIKRQALRTKDELEALEQRVNDLRKRGINTTEVEESFQKANREFRNERYEEARGAIDTTYDRVSEAEATSTQVKAFTAAARQNIAYYVSNNLWELIGGFIAFILLAIEGWREYDAYSLVKRRRKLRLRRQVIRDLISEAQRLYFKEREMSESTYNIKNEKYSKMVLDVNRELPVIESRIRDTNTIVTWLAEEKPIEEEYAQIAEARGDVAEDISNPVSKGSEE